ncbi:MAG TPA: hypothetical protein VJ453_10680 [Terriglobales bacterium]|nr:hypothetical protein [Terriglobales bacterium]
MLNFFSAFASDVFRPLATLLIPGAIGITTWFIALLWKFPELRRLVSANHTESGLALFIAMVFAGMVFDDFGARWEVLLDRWADQRTDGKHTTNWNSYLQIAFKSDPIGRRYARALVLRLKFELGVVFGMISALIGLSWLAWLGLGYWTVFVCSSLCVLFVGWALVEAAATHKVLSQTREALLGNIRIIE